MSGSHALDLAGIRTLGALAAARFARTPDKTAWLEHRTGRWQACTWAQVGARAGRFQAALARAGLVPGDRVAVMLRNGVDWGCLELACVGAGLVVVPVYANDRPDNAAWVLGHSGARALLTSAAAWQALRADPDLPPLDAVILADGPPGAHDGPAAALEPWLGEAGTYTVRQKNAGAPAAIVYTSGTTGRPKGVVLSHGAVLWNVAAATARVPLGPDDRLLSFLPLSHTLERTAGFYAPLLGAAEVAFARGIAELSADLRSARPTALVSVPRIFERAEQTLRRSRTRWPAPLAKAHGALLDAAADAYQHAQGDGTPRPRAWAVRAPLARLAGWPLRRAFGGRLRHAICGGAPLARATARLFAGAGVPILEGYGMTESAPVLSANPPQANRLGTVGPALDGAELRLADNGELLARSPGLMDGYWQNPEATAQALDAEGWLHTGDLAQERDGYWRITGRLKDILVLANGEKVSPADLEQAIAADPLIAQALVVGEGRPFLAALLVLDARQWQTLATSLGLDATDPAALSDDGARSAVLHRVDRALASQPGYARVRAVHLSLDAWTVDNGLLTATLKPRRAAILERDAHAVAALYRGH